MVRLMTMSKQPTRRAKGPVACGEQMICELRCRRGAVSFTDAPTAKTRPAVLFNRAFNTASSHSVMMMITTSTWPHDVAITHLR